MEELQQAVLARLRAQFFRLASAQLCVEMTMMLSPLRASHRSLSLAEISSLEFVQFLSANLAEKKKGSRTLSQNRFCPWEPRRSAGRVGTGARVGRAPVADKVHRTRGWRLSWTRSRCTFA